MSKLYSFAGTLLFLLLFIISPKSLAQSPSVSSVVVTDVSPCSGSTNGSVEITLTANGTNNFTYEIGRTSQFPNTFLIQGPTSSTTVTFSSLPADDYFLRLSWTSPTLNSVSPAALFTISGPDPVSITSSIITDASCNGSNDGEILVSASGETGSYDYTLYTSLGASVATNNTGSFTGLAPDDYYVEISDATCPGTTTTPFYTVNEPDAITISSVNSTNVSCNGDGNGSISVSAAGGNSSYVYTLNPGSIQNTTGSFSSLTPGNYFVSVTDTKNCSAANTAPISITEPSAISVSAAVTKNVSCNGGSDGEITVTASGGAGVLEYSSDGGSTYQGSNIFTGLTAGTYNQLVVRDANGCTMPANPVTINQPPAIAASAAVTQQVSCNGGSDGKITVTASGGTGLLQYSRDGGTTYQVSNVFSGLSAGTYNAIVVKDANGCTKGANSVTITQPTAITATAAVTQQVSCNGGSDGKITVTASGGTGLLQYSRDGGTTYQVSNVFSGLSAGPYNGIVVKDANGCTLGTNPVTITQPTAITATSAVTQQVSCNGGSDGEITVTASGGTGLLQYSRDGGSTYQAGNVFTGLSAGTYNTIVVKDANGCTQGTNSVTITQPTAITATAAVTQQVSCNGGSDGKITVTASGGTGLLQYSRDGGTIYQVSNVFSGLSAGTYNAIVVKDANGCTEGTNSVTITQPTAITATSAVTQQVSCNGGSDGEITVTASGGTGLLQYSRDGGSTYQAGNVFTGLSAGPYNGIVVKDANGCTQGTNSVTITQPTAITATSAVTQQVSCNGGSDGKITVTASGGTGSLQYSRDGGTTYQVSNVFSGLSAGPYNGIVVKDENGCTQGTNSVTITQPTAITATSAVTQQVSCNGGSDGKITVTASGGTGSLQYSRDGGTTYQPGNVFTDLNAGTYNAIVVKDANGCTQGTNSVTIAEPPAITATAAVTQDVTCNGGNNGEITITASGGTGTLQYSIDGGSTLQVNNVFSGLVGGDYNQIVVVDDNNCIQSVSGVTIAEPDVLFATINVTDVTCYGGSDGTITLTNPQGGSGAYEFTIDGGGNWQGSGSFTGLSAGFKDVRIHDAVVPTCEVTLNGNFEVSELPQLSATLNSSNVTGCYGDVNGSIIITNAAGGSGAYEYTTNGGTTWESTSSFTVGAGTYDVRLRDANHTGCELVLNSSLVITQPDPITATLDTRNISCNGGNDGYIKFLNPQGGSGLYQYSIHGFATNGQTSPDFTGLSADTTYIVMIRNRLVPFCPTTIDPALVLNQPDKLTADVTSTNVTCNSGNDGSITITNPFGGSGTYAYSIDGGSSWKPSGTFNNLNSRFL